MVKPKSAVILQKEIEGLSITVEMSYDILILTSRYFTFPSENVYLLYKLK